MKLLALFYCSVGILLFMPRASLSIVNEAEFELYSSLSDKVCPVSNRVFEAEAVSSIHCVAMAAQKTSCVGIGYHGNSNMCYGCDTYDDGSGLFLTLAGTVFYRRQNADSYASRGGYDLKIMKSQTYTYSQATSECAQDGGELVRIDSLQKMQAIQSYLRDSINGFSNGNYWTQCFKDPADDVWKFVDGTPVAMTSGFWNSGQPDVYDDRCCHLRYEYNFNWDNRPCTDTFGYICERVVMFAVFAQLV